jgi:hypothetical protein
MKKRAVRTIVGRGLMISRLCTTLLFKLWGIEPVASG